MQQRKESAVILQFPGRKVAPPERSGSQELVVLEPQTFESQDFSWLAQGEENLHLPDLSLKYAPQGALIVRVEHLPSRDNEYRVGVYDSTIRCVLPALLKGDFAQACHCIRTYRDRLRYEPLLWQLDDLTGSFRHLAKPPAKALIRQ